MSGLRTVALAAMIGFGPITFGGAADFVDIPAIRWHWNDALLDPAEEGVEAVVRQAVFAEHTLWTSCAAVEPGTIVNLLAPPVHGAFTRSGSRQTLYQYVYDLLPCDGDAPINQPRRLAVVEGGEVVWVAEDRPIRYNESLSQVAVLDLTGDGIDELLRWYAGNHHERATIAVFTDDGLRTVAWFGTFSDNCYGDPSFGGAAWSATPTVHPVDAGWPEFALEFVLNECHVYVEPGRAGTDALADALARSAADPAASAMAVLALAWDGDPAAQREAARLFEEGKVLPRDPELAAWWRGRAGDGETGDR